MSRRLRALAAVVGVPLRPSCSRYRLPQRRATRRTTSARAGHLGQRLRLRADLGRLPHPPGRRAEPRAVRHRQARLRAPGPVLLPLAPREAAGPVQPGPARPRPRADPRAELLAQPQRAERRRAPRRPGPGRPPRRRGLDDVVGQLGGRHRRGRERHVRLLQLDVLRRPQCGRDELEPRLPHLGPLAVLEAPPERPRGARQRHAAGARRRRGSGRPRLVRVHPAVRGVPVVRSDRATSHRRADELALRLALRRQGDHARRVRLRRRHVGDRARVAGEGALARRLAPHVRVPAHRVGRGYVVVRTTGGRAA